MESRKPIAKIQLGGNYHTDFQGPTAFFRIFSSRKFVEQMRPKRTGTVSSQILIVKHLFLIRLQYNFLCLNILENVINPNKPHGSATDYPPGITASRLSRPPITLLYDMLFTSLV